MLAIRGALPFIKYVINLIELVTLSHFETKYTIFSILDFLFTSGRLIAQLWFMNYIRKNLGLPLHLLGEAIENVVNLITTLKNFYSACYLIYHLNRFYTQLNRKLKKSLF